MGAIGTLCALDGDTLLGAVMVNTPYNVCSDVHAVRAGSVSTANRRTGAFSLTVVMHTTTNEAISFRIRYPSVTEKPC